MASTGKNLTAFTSKKNLKCAKISESSIWKKGSSSARSQESKTRSNKPIETIVIDVDSDVDSDEKSITECQFKDYSSDFWNSSDDEGTFTVVDFIMPRGNT
ncbi:uncharacterized protein [Rutidosis leptorrhynchoides]|uniref:uncharacterized protein isoform X2 n=1 Tax=Rutidosis leptorrhynchoides TaxID=125765 RepID=UPI003A9A0F1C